MYATLEESIAWLMIAFPCPVTMASSQSLLLFRDAGTGVNDGGTDPPAFRKRGQRGRRCPYTNSIISNVMIYEDRPETNLL